MMAAEWYNGAFLANADIVFGEMPLVRNTYENRFDIQIVYG